MARYFLSLTEDSIMQEGNMMENSGRQNDSSHLDQVKPILAAQLAQERIKQYSLLLFGALSGAIGGLHLVIDDLRVQIRGKQVQFPTDKIIGWSMNFIGIIGVVSSFFALYRARGLEKEINRVEAKTIKESADQSASQYASQANTQKHVSRLLETRNALQHFIGNEL